MNKINASTARAARGRFRHALKSRYAATGMNMGDDIARVIESRTGIPYAAIVVSRWIEKPFIPAYLRVGEGRTGATYVANMVEE